MFFAVRANNILVWGILCYMASKILNLIIMVNQETNYSKKYVESVKVLTPREVEVLEQVAQGYTSSEIAKALHISTDTVKTHRKIICQKLDLQGYRGLFHWSKQHVPST